MSKLKEFLRKHSYILLIVVALFIAGTKYLIYPVFIKKNLDLIEVPVAISKISGQSVIDNTMITTMSISKSTLPVNVITNKDNIVGKYVADGYSIPTNGFFYSESVVDEGSAFGKIYSSLEEGEIAYTLEVENPHGSRPILKKGQHINLYYYQEYENELDGVYRLDHAVTATQKKILKAFNMDARNVLDKAETIKNQLIKADK